MPRLLSTPGRRAVALTLAVVAVVVGGRVLFPPALGANASEQLVGLRALKVGDVAYAGGVFNLGPRGRGTVRVRSARVTGVPDGIEILGYNGVNTRDGSPRAGAGRGYPADDPDFTQPFHPVTDVRLWPGKIQTWYILITVRITKPGIWVTTGLDVSWQRGWQRGTTHFPYHIRLTTNAEPPEG